jgi:Asp-tRNA(Asn)/Glu-tRNA(Gln) amidotransferase A subunit family amidase
MRLPPRCTRREFVLTSLAGIAGIAYIKTAESQETTRSDADAQLLDLTATDAAPLLRSGDLSAERYARALLSQCNRHRDLNAFIFFDEARVMDDAVAADKRRKSGGKLGPLHGIPVPIKDNIDTMNAPTTAGTPALRTHHPKANAPVAEALFSAGAILLGKTNMHELAWGITCNNASFGPVRNPYNSAHIPGGSSGGTGVALAARMSAAGLGTDTGGSVRIPAALCGIVGLRPTAGRYPGKGIVPVSHTRDTAGPMARSIQDLVLLDSVITADTKPIRAMALRGIRIGVPRGFFYDNLAPDLAPVVEAALAKLRDTGCVLVEADVLDVEKLAGASTAPISFYESLPDLSQYLKQSGSELSVKDVVAQIASPDVKALYDEFIVGPKAPTLEAYQAAIEKGRPALQAAYRDYFEDQNVVAIAFPTTPLPARPIGQDKEVELNGKKVSTLFTYIHNTRPMTTAGIPGLSLPIGFTASGLPVGLELDAPSGEDRSLLSLGLAAEQVFGKLRAPSA